MSIRPAYTVYILTLFCVFLVWEIHEQVLVAALDTGDTATAQVPRTYVHAFSLAYNMILKLT